MSKICTKCKKEKEESEFSKDSKRLDGKCPICKSCRRSYNKQKTILKGGKPYIDRTNQPDGFKICLKCGEILPYEDFRENKNVKDGRDGTCFSCKRQHEKNKYYKDITYRASLLACKYKEFDIKNKRENDVDKEFILSDIINKSCFYCGDSLDNIGCDRIDNSKGHLKENVLPCCNTCNSIRSNKFSVDEMKELGKTVREIKIKRRGFLNE